MIILINFHGDFKISCWHKGLKPTSFRLASSSQGIAVLLRIRFTLIDHFALGDIIENTKNTTVVTGCITPSLYIQ